MIKNPILPGFHADPCICRKGDDYYLAVSSFEWFPGIPIYHSRDLKHWELYAHALQNADNPDLKKLPSAKGIWAPCLTYCAQDDLFYVVYGVMNSMSARYFDVDNFLITAKDPRGPWSEPVYLHSAGFDASLFHDIDGRKYVVALQWETRADFEKPGPICIAEYDPKAKQIIGLPKPFWRGGTNRGCIEAPHLTRHGDYYYIMCAEGGTGYYHSVTMGRSKCVWGPYERDPQNPILTSNPVEANERADWDHLKPRYFNPKVRLQKAGHASYVDLPTGETYLVCHTSRPFVPELRCTLGRETSLQRMRWTADGWLRLEGEGNLVQDAVKESALPDCPLPRLPARDDFEGSTLLPYWYAPRIDPKSFASLSARPGWLRLRGQEAGTSLNKVSILARKLTAVYGQITVKMEFEPQSWLQTAGLIIYYDNMNFVYLHKTLDEKSGPVLALLQLENGVKTEFSTLRQSVPEKGALLLRAVLKGRSLTFAYALEDGVFHDIAKNFDLSKLSDEYSKYGEFTGTFAGISCSDRLLRRQCADFDYAEFLMDEETEVN